ncbi:hypothetical protein [Fischerella thermalis]|nr:hypothetical protein [Fischerella thermalis]
MQNFRCDRYVAMRFVDTPHIEQVSLRSPLESPSISEWKFKLD